MAVELVGGAALGAIVGELLKVVVEAKDKILMFRSILKHIEETLQSIIPILKEIEELNKALDRRDEQTARLLEVIEQGKTIVLDCSSIRFLNLPKKYKYTNKLQELDKSLTSFFQIVMQAQIARDTKEVLKVVRGKNWSFRGKIGGGGGGSGMMMMIPGAPVNPVGLEVPLRELKMELFKDGVSVVVLSAPPGCGKTTLAKLLCHDRQVTEKFKDNIFYVTVSKTNTLEGIVRRIFEHKGYRVSEFRGEEDVINRLEQFLKDIEPDPTLLVLDDVWPGSESLLEKLKLQITDYKILVTSRSSFPRFGSAFKLQPLNYDDSMTLFRHSAFFPDQSQSQSCIPEEHVIKIVKGCKGFPLALEVVGGSLRGQPAEIWETREKEFSRSGSILQYSDLVSSLQGSLDALDKHGIVKQCFMDLCSFPEDQRIPVTALIDMWAELYNLDGDVYAVANLHELSNRNLVDVITLREDTSGCYHQQFVMQHDLLRELAIHQINAQSAEYRKRLVVEISGNKVPDWWVKQKHLISAQLLSISTDETFSSTWCRINVPEVEVVILNFRSKNYTLPDFIKEAKKLKVMIVINYGFFPTELGNFALLGSLSNLKRIRLEHVTIPSYGFTSAQFKNLQKMTMVMCNIGQAFSTSSIQVTEALPNLEEINFDYCSDIVELPVEVCHLRKLKKLNVTNCHKLVSLPRKIKELVNLEVLRLGSCVELKELPSTIGKLSNLSILDISECLELDRLPEEIGELQNLSKLHMVSCSDDFKLPSSISELKNLKEVICDEATACLWEPFGQLLKNLRIKVHAEQINLNWLNKRSL
ncbi:hypothetical protein Tsubulata_017836 [Turnera subulata]|uniref:RPW8 domain-containing protein n=1 Tax=Turnera subulata TaxID=218843 RepID=A0A9Q0FCS7_9ROSI|nr:hypothetical protein Tsubulata_017836 [Turnera subulata]